MKARLLLVLPLLGAVLSSCSTLTVAAATVNGQKISEQDVERALRILEKDPTFGQALRRDPEVTRGEGRREVLTGLIYSVVADQEARRRKVQPTQAQVDRLIAERAAAEGMTTSRFLRLQRLTMADAREIARRLVRDAQLEQRVLRSVRVPEERVRQAYEANKQQFEQAHLLRITVGSLDEARSIVSKLKSGADFASLARQSSADELASSGGDMGYVAVSSLGPQEQTALNFTLPGQTTDPIRTPAGYEVLKVLDLRTMPFAEARGQIARNLLQTVRDEAYDAWLRRRVLAAKIVVNPQYGRFDRLHATVVRGPQTLPS